MSDHSAGEQPAPQFELRVTLDASGNVNLHGPLHLKVLCLGALEAAKEALLGYHRHMARKAAEEEARKPKIVAAGPGWPPPPHRNGRG